MFMVIRVYQPIDFTDAESRCRKKSVSPDQCNNAREILIMVRKHSDLDEALTDPNTILATADNYYGYTMIDTQVPILQYVRAESGENVQLMAIYIDSLLDRFMGCYEFPKNVIREISDNWATASLRHRAAPV
ncbi:hypothetical protein J6590_009549 [Homalodisca vitripennis]|nr:hypothetical protein J6590_009549 [Homalodisca vitripennis]